MFKNLLFETRDGIAFLTINRPAARNALNRETLEELQAAVSSIAGNPLARVAILTGAGDKAFVAGADIGELSGLNASGGKAYALAGQAVFNAIESLGKPVIAAVNGFALGGGCELAMACELRIASEEAMFGQPEVKLGLIPGFGGTQRLARLIGKGRALEMLLTGESISAAEAFRIGLVNRVVPAAQLIPTAEDMARRILRNAPFALQCVLDATHGGMETSAKEGMGLEAELFGACCGTNDMREGTRAFLEKRTAEFHGV
jgi:enoyl-CoA hydratase